MYRDKKTVMVRFTVLTSLTEFLQIFRKIALKRLTNYVQCVKMFLVDIMIVCYYFTVIK